MGYTLRILLSHVIICFHSQLQNVLVGSKGNMKISNFGHGVIPQHCKLHRHPHKTKRFLHKINFLFHCLTYLFFNEFKTTR